MCSKLVTLLALLVVVTCIEIAESERVVGLSGVDRRVGRRLYTEDRRKSVCYAPKQRRSIASIHPSIRHKHQHTTANNGTLFNTTVQLWRNGVVPYALSNQFSAEKRARIAEAIDFFTADSCIHWTQRTTETDHVLFTPRGSGGCTADVGRQGGRQAILLGDTECFDEVGNVLQLMLHVVGLYHEHQGVDRDEWLSVNFDNIPPRLHSQFWKVRTNSTALERTRYDFASLTHSGISDRKGQPLFRPKVDGFESVMGQRMHFSNGDVDKLNLLYPCTSNNARTPEMAIETTTTDIPPTSSTTRVASASHRCILLIGGLNLEDAPSIEYYHPTEDECDASVVGRMSTDGTNETDQTSGCYLSESEQIVIREAIRPDKPPMVYGLRDQLAKKLPFPYKSSSGTLSATSGSSAAAIGASQCLSCGMYIRPEDHFANCYQFNTSSDRWTPITPLPVSVGNAASVSLNPDNYYIVGGHNSTADKKEMYRYSISERRWHHEPSMIRGRSRHSAAAISPTEFVVCGGFLYRRDCEVFNARNRRWRRVGHLNTGRRGLAIVSFNGRVYALGGWNNTDSLNSVEAYDPTTESWTSVKPLKHQRMFFVAVVV